MFNRFRYLFGRKEAEAAAQPGHYGVTVGEAITLRDRIMMAYNYRGLAGYTADEVAEHLGVGILTVRPRITELFQAGKLRRTGVKRLNRSGLKAHVFVSTRVPSAGYTASGVPRVSRGG